MKYVLYKFPDVIRRDYDSNCLDPYVVRKRGRPSKKNLRGEVIAVEYGKSIDSVLNALIKAIQDEMDIIYGCESDVYGPDAMCDTVGLMTDEHFDYEMNAVTCGYEGEDEIDLYFGVKELPE